VAPVLAEVTKSGTTCFGAGLEAPTIVEPHKIRNTPYTCEITEKEFAAYPPNYWEDVTAAVLTECGGRTAEDWCRIAVARHAIEEGRHHIARQVTNYEWVDRGALEAAREVVLTALQKKRGRFEVVLPPATVGDKTIHGRADFLEDDGDIWEFKFVSELREEHSLQLACYIALQGGGEGYVLALLSGERRKVVVAPEHARQVLKALADKLRPEAVDVFTLIERFDAGYNDTPMGDETAGDPAVTAQYTADDIYDAS